MEPNGKDGTSNSIEPWARELLRRIKSAWPKFSADSAILYGEYIQKYGRYFGQERMETAIGKLIEERAELPSISAIRELLPERKLIPFTTSWAPSTDCKWCKGTGWKSVTDSGLDLTFEDSYNARKSQCFRRQRCGCGVVHDQEAEWKDWQRRKEAGEKFYTIADVFAEFRRRQIPKEGA